MNHIALIAGSIIFAFLTTASLDVAARGGGGRASSSAKSNGGTKSHLPSAPRSAYGAHTSGTGTSGHSLKTGPGTGSKTDSTSVRSHIRKDGTYVPAHRRTNPDKNFNNNWSTKSNTNPYTGKEGSKTEPPRKK
jgi:hypothetical protein